jgi:hypothetical protein
MGYSLRTERFRYTRWVSGDGTTYARELYDYQEDPLETTNAVFEPVHEKMVQRLDSLLEERRSIPSTQTRINFVIEGPDLRGGYGPLADVELEMSGDSKLTPSDGTLLFTHPSGQVIYQTNHPAYKPLSDTLQIRGDTVISLVMELKEPVYQVSISCSDYYTGKKLISARVMLDEEEKRSDQEGAVSFHVVEGEYLLYLGKNLYPPVYDTLFIRNDTSLHYRLKATHAGVKIRVNEGRTPVNNARVMLNKTEAITSSLGMARFDSLPTAQSYDFRVEKEDYTSLSGSLFLHADTTLSLQMERLTGLETRYDSGAMQVWPNPAGEYVQVRLAGFSGTGRIRIISARGAVLFEQEVKKKQDRYSTSHLSSGIYLVQFFDKNKVHQVKLLVE